MLVEPASISAALDLGVVERTRMLGREAWAVRARPSEEELRRQPGLLNPLVRGADEVQLVVDAERGVLLRVEAFLGGGPFYRVEMTKVAFDEDIADDVFAFPEDDEATSSLRRHASSASPTRPLPRGMLHEGPPQNVLGHPASINTILVRTDSVVIAIERVVAYSSGFELFATVRTRDQHLPGTTEPSHPRGWGGTATFPGESLRFGVAFSDGRVASADAHNASGRGDVMVIPICGSGTGARFDQRFWVRPLPPMGALGLLVEWSGRGAPETRVDVSADAIVDAASRATDLWDTDG